MRGYSKDERQQLTAMTRGPVAFQRVWDHGYWEFGIDLGLATQSGISSMPFPLHEGMKFICMQ